MGEAPHPSDEDLMRQAQEGRLEALEALYDRYAAPLLGYLFRTVGDIDEAHDLLHESFLSLARNAHRYEHPRPFRPWLFTIARNRALNLLGRPRPEPATEERLAETANGRSHSPPEAASLRERAEGARRAFEALDAKDREVIFLRLGEDLGFRDIAEVTGTSVEAARQRLSRAIRRLREMMSSGS